MRKATIAMLLLLVISIGGVCVAAAGVHAPHDQVVFTEQTFYGDKSAAEGLEVVVRSTYNEQLFWDTSYSAGTSPDTKTQFAFSAIPELPPSESDFIGLDIEKDISPERFYDTEQPKVGLAKAYQELFDATAPGEEGTAVVRLKDYMDHYPLHILLELPTEVDWFDSAEDTAEEEFYPNSNWDVMRQLTEYFKIPVLENEFFEIGLNKTMDGKVSGTFGGSADGDSFDFHLNTVLTDDACYFTFPARSWEGTIIDTSLLPDGYGIFRMGYQPNRVDESGQEICDFDIESLDMVYALDPSVYQECMYLSEDETQIYLLTQKDGVLHLTVIDVATMTTVQELEIIDFEEERGGIHKIHQKEDYWVLWLTGGKLAVLDRTLDGLFVPRFCVPYNDPDIEKYSMSMYSEVDWNGERLAVVDMFDIEYFDEVKQYHRGCRSCGFWLLVYDDTGEMLYAGRYDSSLTPGYHKQSCSLAYESAFEPRWKEE